MRHLTHLILLISFFVGLSCTDDLPTYPGAGILVGEWRGTANFYFADFPLYLSIDRVRRDSIHGTMIINFFTFGVDTVTINSSLFYESDSLAFDLNGEGGGGCGFYSMYGTLITQDSLSGSWTYRCVNDPGFQSPWVAHRVR